MTQPLASCRVLVTPRSFDPSDEEVWGPLAAVGAVVTSPTDRPLTSDELQTLLPGIDGYIAGLDVIDAAALDAADRLRVIARYGAGVDRVDLAAAAARGIVVTNTPAANAGSVAELTIGLILALARSLPEAARATAEGGWPRLDGIALEGKTVGLLGLGAVGRAVATRLAGFACTLIGFDPLLDAAGAAEIGVELAPAAQVAARADFLSLHLPVTPHTEGMVDAGFLAAMKPGAFLVNAARGQLVDEAALLAALRSGHLRGAALDTLRNEPPPADHPLLALQQVIVTPHTGGHTDLAVKAMGRQAVHDCLAVLRGEAPAHRVA